MALWSYVKAAFNARPAGMFVPPNWVYLAGVGMLGFINPAFWLFGAAGELAYLVGLSTSKRFQKTVAGRAMLEQQRQWQARQHGALAQLSMDDRAAYLLLQQRCASILEQQKKIGVAGPAELAQQAEGLSRLMWIYMRLLLTRAAIVRLLREAVSSGDRDTLDARVARLQRELAREDITADLRRSYEGQLEILRQRATSQKDARDNLAFIEAELTRIREQVELIKEQAVLSSDPAFLSTRIDEVGGTLSSTTQWMREKQEVFGPIDAMMEEPPHAAKMLVAE
jgi:hypothetical protein